MQIRDIKMWLLMLMCFCASVSAAAEELKSMIVTTEDGDKLVVTLAEKPVVTFAGGEVLLTTARQVFSYTLADHVSLTFGEEQGSGVTNVQGVTAQIVCRDHRVEVAQAVPGTQVCLYDVDGTLVGRTAVSDQGTAVLSLSDAHVQVVKVGTFSLKVRRNRQ